MINIFILNVRDPAALNLRTAKFGLGWCYDEAEGRELGNEMYLFILIMTINNLITSNALKRQ